MSEEFQIPDNLEFNPSGIRGLYSEKVHLTEKSIALNDLVIIEITKQDDSRQFYGDIFLPTEAVANQQLAKGRITSLGVDAKKLNIKEGDIVLYDQWSAFYNPPLIEGVFAITKVENVIGVFKKED